MRRIKRFAFYTIVPLVVIVFFILISLQYTVGIGDARNPEQEGGRCASCLESMAMSSPAEGWAAGEGYFFLRYEHGAWNWIRQPMQTLIFAVAAGSRGDAWGAGLTILRYTGSSSEKVNVTLAEKYLIGVSAVGPDDAWFVGSRLWRYHAGDWSSASLGPDIKPSGVSMLSVDDGWASGTRYDGEKPKNGVLLRYQSGVWTQVAMTDGGLFNIAMASPSEGWAIGADLAGNGVFYHYDGKKWTQASTVRFEPLDQVSIGPNGDAWALGHFSEDETSLYHFTSGAWLPVTLPQGVYLSSVSSVAQDDVWLLGRTLARDQNGFEHGIIFHYAHGTWQTIRIPPRPPAGEWTIALGFAWLAYLLLLIMPLVLGFLFYSWSPAASMLWRNGVTRAMLVWAIVFSLFTSGAIWIGLSVPQALDEIPNGVMVGVFVVLVFFPLAAMLVTMFFMRNDGTFRWRRQT